MPESNLESFFQRSKRYRLALKVVKILEDLGHEVWFAGGCVRDALLKKEITDFDLATEAKPSDVIKAFGKENCLTHGEKFGTIGVKCEDTVFEITTFRADMSSSDGRHPDAIVFSSKEEDVVRRDFTINGMLYHPVRGVFDIVNGEEDLKAETLRAIGDSDARFKEDALRILRLYRFSMNYNFRIEENTLKSALENTTMLSNLSKERIYDEITKTLKKKIHIEKLNFILNAYGISKIDKKGLVFKVRSESMSSFTLAFLQQHIGFIDFKNYILKKGELKEFLFFKDIFEKISSNDLDEAKKSFVSKIKALKFCLKDSIDFWGEFEEIYSKSIEIKKIVKTLKSITEEDLKKFEVKKALIIKENKGRKIKELIFDEELKLYFG